MPLSVAPSRPNSSSRAATSRRRFSREAEIIPLFGMLSGGEQQKVFAPCDRRKIVVATNIAETSLTIDGVSTVIDSGLARTAHYDPQRGFDRLDLGRISQASATQRAGRVMPPFRRIVGSML